jgi:methionine-gamma-lyase
MNNKKLKIDSLCVKEFADKRTTKPHQLPIYATSSFTFDRLEDANEIFKGQAQGHVYSRYGNPTIDTVAQKLADLEAFGTGLDAYGFMTSSGMSAISTVVMANIKSGETILTQSDLYGGTTELFLKIFSQQGVKTEMTDFTDTDKLEQILKSNQSIRIIYMETPANPTMKCIDILAVSRLAKKYGVTTIVDNTFCTPVIQQPLSLGVDFVIHSTTKYLNGHGNSIAGVIIGHRHDLKKQVWTTLKLVGTTSNAWDAWLINNGLKTLALRMERHSANALKIATYLSAHKKVKKVNYNGLVDNPYHKLASTQMKMFGGMLSFDIDGGKDDAIAIINRLQFCANAPTLGDVDTLVLHPATSSHLNVDSRLRAENGITDGLIRLSVGIENVDDIIADLDQALV